MHELRNLNDGRLVELEETLGRTRETRLETLAAVVIVFLKWQVQDELARRRDGQAGQGTAPTNPKK